MKNKVYKQIAIGIAIFDVIAIFIVLHYGMVREAGITENVLIETLKDCVFYPFSFSPFPSSVSWIVYLLPHVTFGGYLILLQNAKRYAHYNSSTVHGASKWFDDFDEFNQKYNDPYGGKTCDGHDNMIISERTRLGYNNEKTRRNANIFIIGGAGSGKSYTLVGPNIMQMNCSMVITDPSGELFAKYGKLLEHKGYKVKIFNLDHMDQGNHYNPFAYIETPVDIANLVTAILDNTNDSNAKGGDQFWTDTAKLLLSALIAYMVETLPKEQRTFSQLMNMITSAQVTEGDHGQTSNGALDDMFNDLENKSLAENDGEPNKSWAVTQYKLFKQAAGKTLQSILISVSSRLQILTVDKVRLLTSCDDMELDKVGDERTALFICIPTGQTTFNFLASMMYTQLFQLNYSYAQNDARYSQCIIDKEKNIWKTFRADLNSVNQVKKQAETYMECIRNHATIRENPQMHWWEIRMDYLGDDVLVGFRGTKEEASHALASLKAGRVMPNSEQTHDGSRMPIHLTFIMDEFANTGRVPNFPEYVATIRKFDISVMIFLQSVTQMKNMYPEEWEGIAGNCDTVIGLGGGADTETAKWFETLLGNETRVSMNTSYNDKGGGSTSLSSSGESLLSIADYRTLDENSCIVIFKSVQGVKDKKYKADSHQNMALSKSLNKSGPYVFNRDKIAYLYDQQGNEDKVLDKHGTVVDTGGTPEGRDNAQKDAEEAGKNMDSSGKPLVETPRDVDPETGEYLDDKNSSASSGSGVDLNKTASSGNASSGTGSGTRVSSSSSSPAMNFSSSDAANLALESSVAKNAELFSMLNFQFETAMPNG